MARAIGGSVLLHLMSRLFYCPEVRVKCCAHHTQHSLLHSAHRLSNSVLLSASHTTGAIYDVTQLVRAHALTKITLLDYCKVHNRRSRARL